MSEMGKAAGHFLNDGFYKEQKKTTVLYKNQDTLHEKDWANTLLILWKTDFWKGRVGIKAGQILHDLQRRKCSSHSEIRIFDEEWYFSKNVPKTTKPWFILN